MRTLRLFALLDHLRARLGPISAEALALELGVSMRTIYRDMATLQAMGAPVRGESGIGYQLEKGYFLPPLRFDADEQEALMLGLRLIAARGDTALASAARRASAKIGAVLGEGDGAAYAELPLRAIPKAVAVMGGSSSCARQSAIGSCSISAMSISRTRRVAGSGDHSD